MQLDLLTGALIGLGVTILAAAKPVVNAYSRALVRKADQLYRDQPVELPREEKKQAVVKQLNKSFIGAPIPASMLEQIAEREAKARDPE
jgi:hypothetical protein